MAKTAAEVIASIKGAGSVENLQKVLGKGQALKNPRIERTKRLAVIEAEYGGDPSLYPAHILSEFTILTEEIAQHEAALAEQFRFEAKKRL